MSLLLVAGLVLGLAWDDLFEKRVIWVEPGAILRGAWQRPGPLRRLIDREGIKTIVTLTAINEDDPKYVAQAQVVSETGVRWVIIPMRGSTATLDELSQAADLVADRSLQPVFFHCVAGHHRSNLVQAAYRIRGKRWTTQQTLSELQSLPWTRPGEARDRLDAQIIEQFALREAAQAAQIPTALAKGRP